QSNELNTMLYEYILYLQGIELGYWKRGIPATLSLLKDAVKKKSAVNISFSTFAKSAIDNSDKKQSTKDNLHSTLAVLHDFRSGLDFKDLTYTFLRDFEQYLREKGNAVNTIAKHM
ncbi:phage integrase SAM-like domain-containing protein, partial [Phocaeicola vulgatus]